MKALIKNRPTRLIIEVAGSIFALISIVLLLLLGRLSLGPIDLDFLTPDVESALQAPEMGLKATVQHTQLVWRSWNRPFEIELVDVRLQKGENPEWLKLSHIGVSLRLYRLIGGDISLKQIRFYHPQILLDRNENGEFSLGFGEESPDKEFSFDELLPLLTLTKADPSYGKLNEVEKIGIINAQILLRDELNDQEWTLPKTTFLLSRRSDGFRTDVTFYPKEGKGYFNAGLYYKISSKRADAYAHFKHISFKSLIEENRVELSPVDLKAISIDDVLNILGNLDMPLNGKFNLAFQLDTLEILKGSCNVDIGKGQMDLSLAKLVPLPVSSGNFKAKFSSNDIEIKNISLLSTEMLLKISGSLKAPSSKLTLSNLLGQGQDLSIQGTLEDLPLDHLDALWPQEVGKKAREWLTQNLKVGILQEATFDLKGHGSEDQFVLDDFHGTLRGENAELTYLNGLPPAQNVNAFATFDQKGFDIKILSGSIDDILLTEGKVLISGLDGDNEALKLDLQFQGPLSDVLQVLNHKPLEYPKLAGIDPQKAKGAGAAHLHMSFPLLADLEFNHIKMDLNGGFKNVSIEREITDKLTAKITDGNFNIKLTQDQMNILGKGKLNQLPAEMKYTHFFQDTKPYDLKIEVDTNATIEDFNRLGFDYREYAKGPTETKLTYILEGSEKSRLTVDIDAKQATLNFQPLKWEKPSGEKANLSFALVFKDGELAKMKDIKLDSSPYTLQGDILFGPQKRLKAIHLSEFKGPHTDTQVMLQVPRDNFYEVTFKGKSVDMEKYLEYVNENDEKQEHIATEIKLLAEVETLRLGEDKTFHSVNASADILLEGQETLWKAISLRAKAGEGTAYKGSMAQVSGGISLDLKPGEEGTQILEIRANDAGRFLKNLGLYEEIQGGYITVKAKRKESGPFVGTFKMKQFDANEVPLLARFAALLSPMGIANLLSEKQTLSMDKFECNFEFSDDYVTVKKGVGKSISLGFTVEGKLDRKDRKYSLKGNIIPARFINAILANIPLIGSLLNGGEGEGLFGIAYTVKGSFEKPDISLNPLSALAPGFIRKLFEPLEDEE